MHFAGGLYGIFVVVETSQKLCNNSHENQYRLNPIWAPYETQ